MKVTCEINDYSNPEKPNIRVHSSWSYARKVELEVNRERYVVDSEELKSAINKATLDIFGR